MQCFGTRQKAVPGRAAHLTMRITGHGCASADIRRKQGSPQRHTLGKWVHGRYSRWDANPQSPPQEGGALSIRPHEHLANSSCDLVAATQKSRGETTFLYFSAVLPVSMRLCPELQLRCGPCARMTRTSREVRQPFCTFLPCCQCQ